MSGFVRFALELPTVDEAAVEAAKTNQVRR
jgi:hypothetical protein